jgi:hypothetical protein
MSNARTVLTSLDHLVAEMVAYPFVSTASFAHPVEILDGRMTPPTAKLWREAERYFVAHFPHIAIDELISVRNRTWFGTNGGTAALHNFLGHTSRDWLRQRGAVAEPCLPDGASNDDNDAAAARRAWRWLTFAMPGDLLLAGLAKNGNGPVRCHLITPFLARMLNEKGYAETHLHMGAGLDFPSAWASAVNVVARSSDQYPGMAYDAFVSPGADHDEGESLANWLVRASIARYVLAAYLTQGSKYVCISEFFNGDFWQDMGLSKDQLKIIQTALKDLATGQLTLSGRPVRSQALAAAFLEMQSTYNALTRASLIPLPTRLDDVQRLDPLSAFFEPRDHGGPTVQIQFLWKGLAQLSTGQIDRQFAKLFWQVERVRCQVYRHCIQRPLTPGLMNFIRVYERKGAITRALENVELESCGVLGGVGKGLRSLEVRTQPAKRKNDQLGDFTVWNRKLEQLRLQPEWENVECGFALHFLKNRGAHTDRGAPQSHDQENFSDPTLDANTMQLRWQEFRQKSDQRAAALAEAIEEHPQWLTLLRAIDVCRDEHGVPTWVVAPLFRNVRERVQKAIASEYERSGIELPELHTTAHVGEDFVHLATGLRYMDEAVDHIPLRTGDRIGHGLALGIDPTNWSKNQHRQLMPREDRWFDLIWERVWHGRRWSRFSSGRKTFVEDEIVRLARDIFVC